jgi:hypothetical protein
MTPPIIRKPSEGRTIAVVGDVYRFLATGDDTNGKYALWKQSCCQAVGLLLTSTAERKKASTSSKARSRFSPATNDSWRAPECSSSSRSAPMSGANVQLRRHLIDGPSWHRRP